MKPLIFEFTEEPKLFDFDSSIIEYSKEKNLTVVKNTETSAISHLRMETETFTKTMGEPSDSDSDLRNELKILMGTETHTRTLSEPTDSDNDFNSLKYLMSTETVTENIEPTDSDK